MILDWCCTPGCRDPPELVSDGLYMWAMCPRCGCSTGKYATDGEDPRGYIVTEWNDIIRHRRLTFKTAEGKMQ